MKETGHSRESFGFMAFVLFLVCSFYIVRLFASTHLLLYA